MRVHGEVELWMRASARETLEMSTYTMYQQNETKIKMVNY